MKFKNYIETESGIKDTSTSPGAAGQVLSSTVTGTSWIDPDTLVSAASKLVVIACKNVSGTPILKGTPVYQSGTVGATDVIEVEPANATISTGYLPAIGILQTTLNNNGFGNVVITGEFLNYSTADIPTDRPGGDPFTGDTVYLAAGGGLTCIKPTGAGNAIQNLGLVGKVSGGNAGSITVASIMRANDVPNLPEGRIWIGDGNTIVSDTVYVDEPNNRVGVGTTSPNAKLEVVGTTGVIVDSGSNSAALLTLKGDASSYGGGGQINIIGGSYDYMYYATNIMRSGSPNINEARESYDMLGNTWVWDGNMGNTAFQPYTSYAFKSQGSSQMVIYNNNVGIGTTSPGAKLDVSGGDIRLQSNATYIKITDSNGQENRVLGINSSNNMYIGPIDSYQGGGIIYGASVSVQYHGFYGGGSEKVRITSSGNVGIGTTNPSELLHLSSTGPARLLIEADTDNVTETDNAQIILKQDGGAVVGNLGYKTDTNGIEITNQYAAADGILTFGTSNAERMRISYLGNVGMGTTNLTTISSSSTTLSLGATSATTSGGIAFQVSGGVVKAYNYVASNYLINQTVSGIGQIFYGAGSERMRIHNTTGNVGIGTTNPSQKLHVVGGGYFQNGSLSIGTTSNVLFNYISSLIMVAGSGQTIALGGGPGNVNNNVLIGNGNLSVSGNVGIGTTSPTQKLHVVGRVASTSGNGFQIINSYGSPWLSDFYGSFTTSSQLYVGGPYSGQACYASAFNITSDYRLKENEVPLTEASSRIKKLKPIRFNYISSENTVDGFLAHEVGEVIPEAVTGEKDAVREDGSDELQGLDLSKIVPLLTAALQETITKIEQLEQRIKTLENK